MAFTFVAAGEIVGVGVPKHPVIRNMVVIEQNNLIRILASSVTPFSIPIVVSSLQSL